jgi:RimJ/RimL family protein N-acetyltransferase
MSRIVAWGSKIYLRPFEDALTDEEIARVYHWSGDEDVLRWSGGAPTELTLAEFRERILSEHGYAPDNRRAFFIVTHEGELIGRIGIFAIDWEDRKGELGIVIGESASWGQGYGRDAVMTLLAHIFETTALERITLLTFPENTRAQRCFAACGFRSLGAARRFSPDLGEFDGIEMEITRHEFEWHVAGDRSRGLPRHPSPITPKEHL